MWHNVYSKSAMILDRRHIIDKYHIKLLSEIFVWTPTRPNSATVKMTVYHHQNPAYINAMSDEPRNNAKNFLRHANAPLEQRQTSRREDRPFAYKQDQTAGSPHIWEEEISRMVKAQAASGIPSHAIVHSVGLAWDTIKAHYSEELAAGKADVEARLSRRLLAIAEGEIKDSEGNSVVPIKDSLSAAKYYLGARFGWKEVSGVEITGKNGKPVETINLNMTPEEAADLYARQRDGNI